MEHHIVHYLIVHLTRKCLNYMRSMSLCQPPFISSLTWCCCHSFFYQCKVILWKTEVNFALVNYYILGFCFIEFKKKPTYFVSLERKNKFGSLLNSITLETFNLCILPRFLRLCSINTQLTSPLYDYCLSYSVWLIY